MRISYLQHTKSEGPGYIAEWAEKRGHELTGYNLINGDLLPALDNFDWLIVLGGPMSIEDEKKHPWLKEEKALINEAMKKKKVVIGICLGAQMMAEALGGRVFKSPLKEIGWYPIQMTHHATNNEIFSVLPNQPMVFHWHSEMFDIPLKASHLALSMACRNQAFIKDSHIIGLQFHLEQTRDSIKKMIDHQGGLSKGRYVQKAEEILEKLDYVDDCNRLLDKLFDRIEEVNAGEKK